jgi:hypothetical protein
VFSWQCREWVRERQKALVEFKDAGVVCSGVLRRIQSTVGVAFFRRKIRDLNAAA